jgi:hypothetical protein
MNKHQPDYSFIPSWADDRLLGFYSPLVRPKQIEIIQIVWMKIHKILGERLWKVALFVVYFGYTWQEAFREVGEPINPLQWAGILDVLEPYALLAEEAGKERLYMYSNPHSFDDDDDFSN